MRRKRVTYASLLRQAGRRHPDGVKPLLYLPAKELPSTLALAEQWERRLAEVIERAIRSLVRRRVNLVRATHTKFYDQAKQV